MSDYNQPQNTPRKQACIEHSALIGRLDALASRMDAQVARAAADSDMIKANTVANNALSEHLKVLIASLNERCPNHDAKVKAHAQELRKINNEIHGKDGIWNNLSVVTSKITTLQSIAVAIILLLIGAWISNFTSPTDANADEYYQIEVSRIDEVM